jgi:hypothetical protein
VNQQPYRVISRATAAWIGALLLAMSALVVWFMIQKIRASSVEFGALYDRSPADAAIEVVRRVHLYAWIYGGSLLAIAAWLAWMASRAIRAQCMPPPGSWIIEGQRTHVGDAALRRGRILLACAGVLALIAVGLFAALWRLAATIEIAGS